MTDQSRPSRPGRYVERLEDLRVLPTPLYASAFKSCHTNEWTNRLGYTVPQSYSSLEEELTALHQGAALQDVSPLGNYAVKGPDAGVYLSHLLVADGLGLEIGKCLSSPMCHSNGKVINIAEAARIGENFWWLTVPGRHSQWLHEAAIGFDVSIEDQSEEFAGIRLVGPRSHEVLEAVGLGILTQLPAGHARGVALKGLSLIAINSPYQDMHDLTVWCSTAKAGAFWTRLLQVGEPLGLACIGERAAHAYRVEAGYPLAGHDYVPAPEAAHADRRRSALELGFEDFLDFDRGVFNGRSALLEEQRMQRSLVFVRMNFEDGVPPAGAHLYCDGKSKPMGLVTSSAHLPHRATSMALGFVSRSFAEPGKELTVRYSGRQELVQHAETAKGRLIAAIKFTKLP